MTRFRLPDGDLLDVPVATSFGRRALGLICRVVQHDDAMLFPRCASVHTWFMRSPIDVVFLDKGDQVLRVARALRPWRFAYCRGAASVLELAAGVARAHELRAGTALTLATHVARGPHAPGHTP